MTKAKKKKSLQLLILVVAMVILAGIYVGLRQSNDDNIEEEEETTTVVSSIGMNSPKQLDIKTADLEMTLVYEDETWKNQEDEDCPMNQTKISAMVTSLGEISADQVVTKQADDLSEYGLDEPSITATLTLEDGSKATVYVGDAILLSDGGRYAMVDDSDTVYVVGESYYTNFHYSMLDLVGVESIPTITTGNVTGLTVESKEVNFAATYLTNEADINYSAWSITKPYTTKQVGDTSAMTSLIGNYTGMEFVTNVDYNCTDTSKYGLDDPYATIHMDYYETYTASTESNSEESTDTSDSNEEDSEIKVDKSLTVWIGNQTEDGEYYYVKTSESNAVQTMTTENVQTLLSINVYDCISKDIAAYDLDSLDGLTIQVGDTTYEITMTSKTSKNEDGEEVTSTTYQLNGKEMDESGFTIFYDSLKGLQYAGEVKETTADQNEVISYVLHITGADDVTISCYPYDDNYYKVKKDGMEQFLVDQRDINKIISSVQELNS